MKTPKENEYVTTLNEGPIAINLEVLDSEGNDFEKYKRLEDKVISPQSLEFKIFPIAGNNNLQDFRTNLLQEIEYDMIRAALKPKLVNDPIPNTRVQDFNEDFHGLSRDEWKKHNAWIGQVYIFGFKTLHSRSKKLKIRFISENRFILHKIIHVHEYWAC